MAKKILDLDGLTEYDTELKGYVADEVDKLTLETIPDADIEELFQDAGE